MCSLSEVFVGFCCVSGDSAFSAGAPASAHANTNARVMPRRFIAGLPWVDVAMCRGFKHDGRRPSGLFSCAQAPEPPTRALPAIANRIQVMLGPDQEPVADDRWRRHGKVVEGIRPHKPVLFTFGARVDDERV